MEKHAFFLYKNGDISLKKKHTKINIGVKGELDRTKLEQNILSFSTCFVESQVLQ